MGKNSNIIELCRKFRGSLWKIQDSDMEKKMRILKKVAELIVIIFDQSVGRRSCVKQ
jgi:hypothetical protein